MIKIPPSDYRSFFVEIKEMIFQAQLKALRAVNSELLNLYSDIGKIIVCRQEDLGWGKSVVENLSSDLQKEFPGIKGFSARNLWRMRNFYLEYKDNPKLPPLVAEISWSHNIIVMEKCKDVLEREFYIKNIRGFLLEMGGDFSFIGNQYKLDLDGEEFFIDLLLYHRRLKCLVAIELKATDFKPEHTGQIQFYLAVLDDKVRQKGENPSIGIIICKTKNRTVVEYALRNTKSPVGVADYETSKTLPGELKGLLPSPDEIIKSLSNISED